MYSEVVSVDLFVKLFFSNLFAKSGNILLFILALLFFHTQLNVSSFLFSDFHILIIVFSFRYSVITFFLFFQVQYLLFQLSSRGCHHHFTFDLSITRL